MLLSHDETLIAPCASVPTSLPAALLAALLAARGGVRRRRATGAAAGSGSASTPQRAFDDLAAQVAIGPRPAGSRGQPREVAADRASACARPGFGDVDDPAPVPQRRRADPREQAGRRWSSAPTTTPRTSPGSSAPTTAPRASRSCSSWRGTCRDRVRRARRSSSSLFDAEEARGERAVRRATATRGSRQFVRYAQARRRAGLAAAGRDPRDGALRHGRRLRPADPARGELDPGLYAPFADAARPSDGGSRRRSRASAPGVVDDHTPFAEAGVPAVDLIDFTYGPGPAPGRLVAHDRRTRSTRSARTSLGAVGEAALRRDPRIAGG